MSTERKMIACIPKAICRVGRMGTLLGTAVLLSLPLATQAQGAPGSSAGAGCTLNKGTYTCNWRAFQPMLAAAHTIDVQSPPRDRFSATQLRELVASLGKTVATPGQPADMTFLLVAAESDGVNIGPADQMLATLRIYAPDAEGHRGKLLWAETLAGPADRPWPSNVHVLLEQFRARVRQR